MTPAPATGETRRTASPPPTTPGELQELAVGLMSEGKLAPAIKLLEEASPQLRGERADDAHRLMWLGLAYMQQGDFERATERYTASNALFAQVGDMAREAETAMNLGGIEAQRKRWADSAHWSERARRLFHQLSDFLNEANALTNLGTAAKMQGQLSTALDAFQHSYELFAQEEQPRGAGLALAQAGFILEAAGKIPEATRYVREAVDILEAAAAPEAPQIRALLADVGR